MNARWTISVLKLGLMTVLAAACSNSIKAADDEPPVKATRGELADAYGDLLVKLAETAKETGNNPPSTTNKSFRTELNLLDQRFRQASDAPPDGDPAPALTTIVAGNARRAVVSDRLDELSAALTASRDNTDARLRALKVEEQQAIDTYRQNVQDVIRSRQTAVAQAQSLASGQAKVVTKITAGGPGTPVTVTRDATPEEAGRFVERLRQQATQSAPLPVGVAAIRDTENQVHALRTLVNEEVNHLKVAKEHQKKEK